MLAAGLLHSEAALKPDPDIDVRDNQKAAGADEHGFEIEVQANGLHPVAPPSTDVPATMTELVTDEHNATCPNCRRPGRVDMVDLVGHSVHMSCPGCGTMWRARRAVIDPDD
jgi:hypothetical protein